MNIENRQKDLEKITSGQKEVDLKEEKLQERLNRLSEMEQQIKEKEKRIKEKEKAKKQVPLRLSASLWEELAVWAEDDFRSINGQIEFLLAECVKNRKKK